MKSQKVKAFITILGIKVRKDKTPLTVNVKRFVKKLDTLSDDEAQEFLEEKDYVAALGICAQGIGWENLTQLLLQEILLVLTCTMLMKLFLKALSSRYACGNE